MSDLPKGWESTTLGEVAEILRGVTYKKEQARSGPEPSLVPLLRATNISQNLNFDELVYVPESCVSDSQMLRRGDIVVAASSGSKSVVGKAASLNSDWSGTFGAFCSTVRPAPSISSKFVGYYLQTIEYRNYVSEKSSGVNINNLKSGDLAAFGMRLARREEQDRIVAEIEKQFTRLDAATAALKRAQVNLKRYRASVLKAACEGRLVPTEAELAWKEGRDYEPADKLLERILKERRVRWETDTLAKMIAAGKSPKDDRWKQRYREPSAPDPTFHFDPPAGWCLASMDQLTSRITSGSRDWTPYYGRGSGVFVMAQNVRPGCFDASTRCLVPEFDGAYFSHEWKEALWARYFTGAPVRQRQFVERYSIVKKA